MTKDLSNNKTIKNILPKNSGIKKPPLLLCNDPYNNIHKKLFRNNTYNNVYNMNRLRLSLDNYKYSSNPRPNRTKPIRRDLFKKWIRDIDTDYQKKFGKDDFYIDHYKSSTLINVRNIIAKLPTIIEKKKISIQIEINNLNDLIELTEKYPIKHDVEYNINMEAIHNIKEPVKKIR